MGFLAKLLGNILYFLDRRRKKVVFTNINMVYPDKTDNEKVQLAKTIYENFAYNFLEMIKNRNIPKEELESKIEFEGLEKVEKYLKSPAVFISAHYGNWDMISLTLGEILEIPMTVVIREKSYKFKFLNSLLLRFFKKSKEKLNIKTIDKKGALKGLMKAVKEGRSIGIFVDQNTAENEGVDVKMFGFKALQTPSAALLAKKFNLPIIPVFIQRNGDKYKVIFKDPIFEKDINKSVQAQSDVIEEMIKQKPEEWYWFHRRFKHYYEDRYE
jgi:KDO2-lipid IV(A) lauroyltransferase